MRIRSHTVIAAVVCLVAVLGTVLLSGCSLSARAEHLAHAVISSVRAPQTIVHVPAQAAHDQGRVVIVVWDGSESTSGERKAYVHVVATLASALTWHDQLDFVEISPSSQDNAHMDTFSAPGYVFAPGAPPTGQGSMAVVRFNRMQQAAASRAERAFNADHASTLKRLRHQVLAKMSVAILSARGNGTDVLGALDEAGALAREASQGHKLLVLLTDGQIVANGRRINGMSGQDVSTLIGQYRQASDLPRLDRLPVLFVGVRGADVHDTLNFPRLRLAWQRIMKACGTSLSSDDFTRAISNQGVMEFLSKSPTDLRGNGGAD